MACGSSPARSLMPCAVCRHKTNRRRLKSTVAAPFSLATIAAMPDLRAIVALGRVAHESVVRAFGLKSAACPFTHGAEHVLPLSGEALGIHAHFGARTIALFDSYHCSRYNTNTGVLTPDMFRAIFAKARERLRRL